MPLPLNTRDARACATACNKILKKLTCILYYAQRAPCRGRVYSAVNNYGVSSNILAASVIIITGIKKTGKTGALCS